MVHIIVMSLIGLVVVAWFIGSCSLVVRQLIATSKGDWKEVDRLSTPYDIAETMARRDFGTTPEEFEATMKECLAMNEDALPYDAYLLCEHKMHAEDIVTPEDNA